MVWGENFSIRIAPDEIVFIEYFVEESSDYRFETGIPLTDGKWQQLESAALMSLPDLTEIKPQKETLWKRLFKTGSFLSATTGNTTIPKHRN